MTNNEDGSVEPLAGATLALYHVTDGKVDYLVDTHTTDSDGKFYSAYLVDASESYVLIETDSTVDGFTYDTQYDGNVTSTCLVPDPETDIIGQNVSDLQDTYGSNIVQSIHFTAGGTSTGSMTNYIPFVQLTFMKSGEVWRWNSTTEEYEYESGPTAGLNHAKFILYVMDGDDYAAAVASGTDFSALTEAQMKTLGATTDGYTYETGTLANGTFVTDNLDYSSGKVYFFYEKEAPVNYSIGSSYVITTDPATGEEVQTTTRWVGPITPDMYSEYKNSVYTSDGMVNKAFYRNGGTTLYRYIQFEVEKCFDMDEDEVYDAGTDTPLASVTFQITLTTLDGSELKNGDDYVMSTKFTTGVNKDKEGRDEGYGVSESLYLSQLLYNYISDSTCLGGYTPDDIFKFSYNPPSGTEYDQTLTVDFNAFLNAQAASEVSETNPYATWQRRYFDLECRFILTEVSYPLNSTPWHEEYVWNVKTKGTTYTVTSDYYYDGSHGPVLNLQGQYVLVRPHKYISSALADWTPADEDDYVTFWFHDLTEGHTEEAGYEHLDVFVTINSSNYDDLPLVQLNPSTATKPTTYSVTEIHVPKGYDKPEVNYKEFQTSLVSSRTSKVESERVMDLGLEDQPYVQLTFKKTDSSGNALKDGVRFQIRYYGSDDDILDANGEALPESETILSSKDGQVVFSVPLYDYRVDEDAKYRSTEAAYEVIELDDPVSGSAHTSFEVMNSGLFSESNTAASGTTQLINPESGTFSVTKLAKQDETAPLSNVSFILSYRSFQSLEDEILCGSAPAKLTSGYTQIGEAVTTNTEGKITFSGMYSGFYCLTETIPGGFMNEGKSFDTYFLFISAGDAINLKRIYSCENVYWTDGGCIILQDQAVKEPESETVYDTATVSGTDLTVTNTAKGRLKLEKTVAQHTLSTVPASVTYYITAKDSKTVLKTVQVSLTDAKGESDLILLEPGLYDIYESLGTDNAQSWVGAYTIDQQYATYTTDADQDTPNDVSATMLNSVVSFNGDLCYKVGGVTVSRANTGEAPVEVSFTNRTTKLQASLKKVDDSGDPVTADFAVYRKATDGSVSYYTGSENGLGTWAVSLASAKAFTTGSDGTLTIDFQADVTALTVDSDNYTYYLKELRATPDYLDLVDDVQLDMTLGETSDISDTPLVDGSGLYLTFTLIGRTAENAAADGNYPPLADGEFKLYKVDKNGKATEVPSTGLGNEQKTTDDDGNGYFLHLPLLEEGESYVLVQTKVPSDYWDTGVYTDANCDEGCTVPVEEYADGINGRVAFTVFTYETQQDGTHQSVLVYNQPKSYVLLLKYDYKHPDQTIPENAIFKMTWDPNRAYSETDERSLYMTATTSAAMPARLLDSDGKLTVEYNGESYTYHAEGGKYYFTDSEGKKYSFYLAGNLYWDSVDDTTYDVLETSGAQGYLYTPNAKETDPWYTEGSVKVDDDGHISVIRFANVETPSDTTVSVDKAVTSVNGGPDDDKLDCLQDGWQYVDYTISNFAPGRDRYTGQVPDCVEFPITDMVLEDTGITFTGRDGSTLTTCDAYVAGITVGVANCLNDMTVDSMPVAVYGLNENGEVYITTVDVATASASVDFPAETYYGFRLKYNCTETTSKEINPYFHADPVSCRMYVKQDEDTTVYDENGDPLTVEQLAYKVTNSAAVTMAYDIGTETAVVFSVHSTAVTEADDEIILPTGSIVKTTLVTDASTGELRPMKTGETLAPSQ